MQLEDEQRDLALLNDEAENIFNEHYLANLSGPPPFVCLEEMHKPGQRCTALLEKTADALSSNVVALMLLSVQKDSLELNIQLAVKWVHSAFQKGRGNRERLIKLCIWAFPMIWYQSDQEVEEALVHLEYQFFDRLEDEFELSLLFKHIFSRLGSFVVNPPLSISNDDTHHMLIAIILILDNACLSYASQPQPDRNVALDMAYSRYKTSDTHMIVTSEYSAPSVEYSIPQLTEFILAHRLR